MRHIDKETEGPILIQLETGRSGDLQTERARATERCRQGDREMEQQISKNIRIQSERESDKRQGDREM
jgi:hypothetical protein